MLKEEFLEKIFGHKEMQKIPIGCQSTAVSVISELLEDIKEENPYATITELFESTVSNGSTNVSDLQSSTAESLY